MVDKFGQRRDFSDTFIKQKSQENLRNDDATPRVTVSDQNISLNRPSKDSQQDEINF